MPGIISSRKTRSYSFLHHGDRVFTVVTVSTAYPFSSRYLTWARRSSISSSTQRTFPFSSSMSFQIPFVARIAFCAAICKLNGLLRSARNDNFRLYPVIARSGAEGATTKQSGPRLGCFGAPSASPRNDDLLLDGDVYVQASFILRCPGDPRAGKIGSTLVYR